jgi:hypothetical protein
MASENPSDHVLMLEEAQPYLEPLVPTLTSSLWEAWDRLQKLLDHDPEWRAILDDTSTLAAMLSNSFRYFAAPRLASECGLKWENVGRMQHGSIDNLLDLRFKKFTTDLHSMNIPTQRQIRIYNQQALPGAQRITQVTYGYTLERLARSITGIYFVCPKGWKENHWVWPLYGDDDGTQLKIWDGTPFDPSGGNFEEPGLDVEIKVTRRKAKNG